MPARPSPAAARRQRPAPPGVLLVHPHPVSRIGLRRLLAPQKRFIVVGEAATAAEALEQVRRRHPALVLMDLAVGEGPALELIGALAGPGGPAVVVLADGSQPLLLAQGRGRSRRASAKSSPASRAATATAASPPNSALPSTPSSTTSAGSLTGWASPDGSSCCGWSMARLRCQRRLLRPPTLALRCRTRRHHRATPRLPPPDPLTVGSRSPAQSGRRGASARSRSAPGSPGRACAAGPS